MEVSARDSNRFTVSVNINPESKATFYLTYEELLVRKDGKYEIVLNIHPGEPVKDLLVQASRKSDFLENVDNIFPSFIPMCLLWNDGIVFSHSQSQASHIFCKLNRKHSNYLLF